MKVMGGAILPPPINIISIYQEFYLESETCNTDLKLAIAIQATTRTNLSTFLSKNSM